VKYRRLIVSEETAERLRRALSKRALAYPLGPAEYEAIEAVVIDYENAEAEEFSDQLEVEP
jgi:hypothetical protein